MCKAWALVTNKQFELCIPGGLIVVIDNKAPLALVIYS